VVFDLDMCAWSPEMYTLHKPPTIAVPGDLAQAADQGMLPAAGAPVGMAAASRMMKGVVGAANGQDTVRLFPGALLALQEVALGKYPGMRVAAASSADNANAVACAKASLALLEILPGLTFKQLLARGFEDINEGNVQIGRSAPLSSDKTTHFNLLKKNTGIDFDKMLFFDDVSAKLLSHCC
jgi:magnesium-dependent phosphatase 1